MIKIPKNIKLELFNILIKQPNVFGEFESDTTLIEFLNSIWPLKTMPSTDIRYTDAYGDIVQHIVNNDDWDFNFLFIDILKLLENDKYFNLFLETIVSPKFKKSEDEIFKFVLLINSYLEKCKYKLAIKEYAENGFPIYTIELIESAKNIPIDIKPNSIPFFVIKNNRFSIKQINQYFTLVFNDNWNDYGKKTEFNLYYHFEKKEKTLIGITKIMTLEDLNTSLVIPDNFEELSEDFCSLGQTESYYENLKNIFGNEFESILYALKDSAFFIQIQEKFENSINFTSSLIRYDEVERLLRETKYSIYGYDLSNLYSFKFIFTPLFSKTAINIEFNFNNKEPISNRIYALIGKNGTGKTQLITSLPLRISAKDNDVFSPRAPLFSKVIAVSYSVFDNFEIPHRTATFNYTYCGLRNVKGEDISERGLILRFHNTWKKIEKLGRTTKWYKILINFIDNEIVDTFIELKEAYLSKDNMYTVNIEGYNKVKTKLSSGQSNILYIVSEIVANIRFDSLVLYDEPETHLHPNAITKLMNTIYELVNEFESYCIIATHSPLVIRELLSRNVYILERIENFLTIKRIGIESFGENLTTLTEEVFGNKDVPKQYKKIIDSLINDGNSFEEIVKFLEFDEFPLSLNTRLYIQSKISS